MSKKITIVSAANLPLICAGAAALALFAAFVMQYGFKLYPCKFCLWQRYPYAAIVVLGVIASYVARRKAGLAMALIGVIVLLFMVDASIAFYHSGVEMGIVKSDSGCITQAIEGEVSLDDLRAMIEASPIVACDQAGAELFGLSIAMWNGLFASVMALFTLAAFRPFMRKIKQENAHG